jgi:hypothetical protein
VAERGEHVPFPPDSTATVQTVVWPALMVTLPAGVPEYCGRTRTRSTSDLSCPYRTEDADSDSVVFDEALVTWIVWVTCGAGA